jgi:proteasome component ECM29
MRCRWGQLAGHFGALWEMGLRALDDIKETVRQAAVTLARSLKNLTLRLVDAQQSGAAGGC